MAAAVRPADCARVEQNPPDFSWPHVGSGPYTVNLTFPDSRTESRTATDNWLNWDGTLPAGDYAWTVTRAGVTSLPRRFTVSVDAVPFVVPDIALVLQELLAKAHPRGLPDRSTLSTMASQRQYELTQVRSSVDALLGEPLPPSGNPGDGDGQDRYGMKALASLMAYVYDGTDLYKDDAKRRVLNLASWDPRGPTAIDDQESRFIAGVVTLGYDWLGSAFSAAEREQVLAALNIRIGDLYDWVSGIRGWPAADPNAGIPPPIWQRPRDSHRNVTVAMVAIMSTLLVGDLPAAQTWMRDLLPLALNLTSPWSGEEGGYANGTAYSIWDVGALLTAWYVLRLATCGGAGCIDMAHKAWVRNWGRFITYFVPPTYPADEAVHEARKNDPGTPIGLFGDGFADLSLLSEVRSSYAKGYAHFAPGALACWYASGLARDDQWRIEYLMSPPNTCPAPASFPSATPSSLYLPSIGWIAMHSDLADLDRTSVYFKSSPRPFGAFNHQSADQNAFVVNAGGERLAIESGYFDAYNSNHWQYWVKRTRSKNAITFDGGQGQVAFEHLPDAFQTMGFGSIVQQSSAADFDVVTGDATQAYNGALKEARRSMVYLRPNLALVYDRLASDTPRQWEWNIHALNQINAISDRQISIEKNGQRLCVDMLAGPAMSFTQTDLFTADPSGDLPRQWHGNFYSVERLGGAEFIALLNVGCTPTAASASKADGVWIVPVGDKVISIAADGGISVGSSSDAVPPAVSITSPAPGSAVSGTISVAADASDNVAVVGVQFKYDGISFNAEDTTAPYSTTADTKNVPNGSYTLTAVARDAAGNRTTSAPVSVIVANDTTPPTIGITSPASGATVSGTVTVAASASDNVGVVGVQFQYNGINLDAEDTIPPYTATGQTNQVPNGSYTLTAIARDAAGNRRTSAPVTVTVSNP